MSLPIAIQVFSVRNEAEADLLGTLKRIKELGYDGVEFAGLYGHSGAQVKAMCEQVGLVPISGHISMYDINTTGIDELVATYAEIGVKFLAMAWLAEEDRPGGANWDNTLKVMTEFGKKAKAAGITFLYHNHDFEFEKLDGKYLLDIIYDSIPADYLQSELDTCWVNVGGEEPAAYIAKFAGRAPVVHLKDFVGSKSENMYELIGDDKAKSERQSTFGLRHVGQGVQNFPAIIESAISSGAQWLVVEQDNPSPDMTPFECAQKSREYLKSIGY